MLLSEGTVTNIPPNEGSEGNSVALVCCGPLLGLKENVVGEDPKNAFTAVLVALVDVVDSGNVVARSNCEIASEVVELVDVSDVVGSVGLGSINVGVRKV